MWQVVFLYAMCMCASANVKRPKNCHTNSNHMKINEEWNAKKKRNKIWEKICALRPHSANHHKSNQFCYPLLLHTIHTRRPYECSSILCVCVLFCTFSFRSVLMNLLCTVWEWVSERVCASVCFILHVSSNKLYDEFLRVVFRHTFYHKLLLHFYFEHNFFLYYNKNSNTYHLRSIRWGFAIFFVSTSIWIIHCSVHSLICLFHFYL